MKQRRWIFPLAFVSLILPLLSLGAGCHDLQAPVKSPEKRAPVKSPEKQAREILSSADAIKVEVVVVGYPDGGEVTTYSTEFKPAELKSVVENLKLGAKRREPYSWGTDVTPTVDFTFLEKGKKKAVLFVGYGAYAFDYFMAIGRPGDFPNYWLDETTVRQLRHIIARDKKLLKALCAAGCSSKDIDPDHIPPSEEPRK